MIVHENKPLFLGFFVLVQGGRVLLLCHTAVGTTETLRQHHGKKVLLCR